MASARRSFIARRSTRERAEPMRILYAETTAYAPSSAHFLEALEASTARGEHEFRFLDEAGFIKSSRSIAERIADRVAGRPLSGYQQLNRALVEQAAAFSPDLILVGKGRWFTASALEAAKKVSGAMLVNWATDDPFNRADNSRELLKSIPLYDLYVCTKQDIMSDVRRAGCANVAYVRFGTSRKYIFRKRRRLMKSAIGLPAM